VVLFAGLALVIGPPPGPDPVTRISLAEVTEPVVDSAPPHHGSAGVRIRHLRNPGALGGDVLASAPLSAFPAREATVNLVVWDRSEPEAPPQLDPPLPGAGAAELVRSVQESTTLPVTADRARPQLAALQAPAVMSLAPAPDTRSPGKSPQPGHYLQAGYFSARENADSLAASLAEAGVGTLVEERRNSAGSTRWRVLAGPFAAREDAFRAKQAQPGLLADAFPARPAK